MPPLAVRPPAPSSPTRSKRVGERVPRTRTWPPRLRAIRHSTHVCYFSPETTAGLMGRAARHPATRWASGTYPTQLLGGFQAERRMLIISHTSVIEAADGGASRTPSVGPALNEAGGRDTADWLLVEAPQIINADFSNDLLSSSNWNRIHVLLVCHPQVITFERFAIT